MQAFICDAQRTPIGRYGGALSTVRADDLAAIPIKSLIDRNAGVDWDQVDDVIYGCANQAGEDNRNVARMASLLAGLPESVPGSTINRLCASGMDAVGGAARGIKAGELDLVIAGGVESMSRAPFVMPKAETAFSRANTVYDTTIGWRFVNPKMKAEYGDRFDASDGGQRGAGLAGQPRGSGRLRRTVASPLGRSTGGRTVRRGNLRRHDPAAQGRSDRGRDRRASPPGHGRRKARRNFAA